jgi:hypothetical protein
MACLTNNPATNVIGVGYVMANCSWQPQVTIGTNAYTAGATNLTYSDWSQVTNWVVFTLPQGPSTNYYFNVAASVSVPSTMVMTNIASTTNYTYTTAANVSTVPSTVATANWIGVVAVTNSGILGGYVTNFAVGLSTKLLLRPMAP